MSPLACVAEPPGESPPVVVQVSAPAAEPLPAAPPAGGSRGTNAMEGGAVVTSNALVTASAAGATHVTTLPAEVPRLSPAMEEVVKLLQAGVSPEVVEAFITNAVVPFHVGSAELLYLQDLGAPAAIMTALIQHDAQPAMQALKQVSTSAKPEAVAVAATPPAVPDPPEPTPVPRPATEPAAPAPPPSSTSVYQVPDETRTVSYSYFYGSLAPYGTWMDVPGFGFCWRPTVAVYQSSWRPYCDGGRWLWSDRGWYWHSGYSWGWAPFHYGRWCQPAGLGWVWVPSTCWGPAWVSWRYTTAGYCGWAPLPPAAGWVSGVGFHSGGVSVGIGFDFGLASSAYVFCPAVRFCDPRPVRHCVPPHQSETHYRGSTVVNQYITGNNNTVINQGFGYEKVARVTKEGIRKVTVQDVAARADRNTRPERISEDGRVVSVQRPAWASVSDRATPARSVAGGGVSTPVLATGSNPRSPGPTGSRSWMGSGAGATVRPSLGPPAATGGTAVKPVASPAAVEPGRNVPVTVVGAESKPQSLRRGPGVNVANPGGAPSVIRPPAVSPSRANLGSQATVVPDAPRPVPSRSTPKTPSVSSLGSQGPVPALSPGAVSVPRTLYQAPPPTPVPAKPVAGPGSARPARPVASVMAPRGSAPVTVAPAPAAPASSRQFYAASGPVAPRVSTPPASSGGGSRGGHSAPALSSSGGQGGRSSGSSAAAASGKAGR